MKIRALLFVLFLSTVAAAQGPAPDATNAQREAMKQCSFRVGQWKGEGWMMLGAGQRRTFTETEDVASKLDGLVLVIEGNGKDAAGKPIHQALAMMAYDSSAKAYRFRSYDGYGHYVEAPSVCVDGVMRWNLSAGPRNMRFTIKLNDNGQWFEIGEVQAAGEWQKFFEMTLARVQ